MTSDQRITLINEVLSTDGAAEFENVLWDEAEGHETTLRERCMAAALSRIYSISHPARCKACGEREETVYKTEK